MAENSVLNLASVVENVLIDVDILCEEKRSPNNECKARVYQFRIKHQVQKLKSRLNVLKKARSSEQHSQAMGPNQSCKLFTAHTQLWNTSASGLKSEISIHNWFIFSLYRKYFNGWEESEFKPWTFNAYIFRQWWVLANILLICMCFSYFPWYYI